MFFNVLFILIILVLPSSIQSQAFNPDCGIRVSTHNAVPYTTASKATQLRVNGPSTQKNVRKQNYSAKVSSARVPSSAPFFDLTTLRPRGERPTRLVHPDDRVSEIRPACPVDGRGKSRVELGAGKGGS